MRDLVPLCAQLHKLLLHDPLHQALRTLFSEASSILESPIPDHPRIRHTVAKLPEFISSANFDELISTDAELAAETIPLDQARLNEEGKNKGEKSAEAVAARIQKDLEKEAQVFETWKVPQQDIGEATRMVKAEMGRLGLEVSAEGSWMLGYSERSARSIEDWEKIGIKTLKKVEVEKELNLEEGEEAEVDLNGLYRIHLSQHRTDFPLTTLLSPPSEDTGDHLMTTTKRIPTHDLGEKISLIIPASYFKSVTKSIVLEADYQQIIFIPRLSSSAGSTKAVQTLWILKKLYRVVPSYYRFIGEHLRDEPGRMRSFPGGWGEKEEALSEGSDADEGLELSKREMKGNLGMPLAQSKLSEAR